MGRIDATTWSPILNELVEKGMVGLGPYSITLDYSYWTYAEIIEAILPEEDVADGEFPEGFTLTGHVCKLAATPKPEQTVMLIFRDSTFESPRAMVPL